MTREEAIEKIKKCLALGTNNPSQFEAQDAILQAQKLMSKYGVDVAEAEEETPDTIDTLKVDAEKYDTEPWKFLLAGIVGRNFRCENYRNGIKVAFVGYRADTQVAKEAFSYLYKVIKTNAWKMYNREYAETGSGKGVVNSYVQGFLKGLTAVLDEQCTALMIVTPKEVKTAFTELSKNFKTVQIGINSSNHNSSAFNSGVIDGKNSMSKSSKKIGVK